ncbi:hypothetical protein [Haloglycomyces albus]|uniref:hypothetical protein n=1 Tax=Haloglycomyces albus TaxID=526067 RepID=UPI00046CDD6E|nr:hypothetical protein [Haloglycomyces albus]
MSDVEIRVNRLGAEKGRGWQAIVLAALLALPLVVWLGAEDVLGVPTERLSENEGIELESFPGKTARLEVVVADGTWTARPSLNADSVTLTQGTSTVSIGVFGSVESLERLIERRADVVTRTHTGLVATSFNDFESSVADLNGQRATLVGRNVGGGIFVVGNDSGAAATIVALGPASQSADTTLAVVNEFISRFTLEGE